MTLFIVIESMCYTRVVVKKKARFNCDGVGSDTFKVRVNDTIIVKAEHMSANILGSFIQCVAFSQKGNCNSHIQLFVY